MERRKLKRETLVDKVMNKVVLYGGLPVRYGTMFRHLEEVAKATGEKNWMAIRDAGLMGYVQSERMHPTELPDDVEPLTYEEFEELMALPSGSEVPEPILRKWGTIYPAEVRLRLSASKRKKAKRATAQAGVRGVR